MLVQAFFSDTVVLSTPKVPFLPVSQKQIPAAPRKQLMMLKETVSKFLVTSVVSPHGL